MRTDIDKPIKYLHRKSTQDGDQLTDLASPPVPSLTRHHRSGHDASIGVDKVEQEELQMPRLRVHTKLESVDLCLEDLIAFSRTFVGRAQASYIWKADGPVLSDYHITEILHGRTKVFNPIRVFA